MTDQLKLIRAASHHRGISREAFFLSRLNVADDRLYYSVYKIQLVYFFSEDDPHLGD
jgi:hypothetical protein